MLNQPDFLSLRQLDLENKLILPSTQLYKQACFKLNVLYENIRNFLIDAHSTIAAAAKQVYDDPIPTLTAWYEQAASTTTLLYAQAQTTLLPVYQSWQVKVNVSKARTGQYLQAFWENPEQVTLATLEPIKVYLSSVGQQSERYWQSFIQSPEQFLTNALAPINNYLGGLGEHAEAILISNYYALVNVFNMLMAQPAAALQALYNKSLSALLDVYFDVVSSLMTML